jgi:5,10-methylene-tetrahydrofolate dehydrogenase/methenyl tetrahydrofolate cyclohydrolase
MMPLILNGRALAEKKLHQLKDTLIQHPDIKTLSIIQIGHDPASTQFVNLKKSKSESIGLKVRVHRLDESYQATYDGIRSFINKLTKYSQGILLQLPLPPTLSSQPQQILDLIPREFDVDGLRSDQLSEIKEGTQTFLPAVVQAVISIIEEYHLIGKDTRILVIGNGRYVGAPIFDALSFKFPETSLSVLLENSVYGDKKLQEADLVISCVGKPHQFTEAQLKKGAVLIDVGTSKDPLTGKIVGDFAINSQSTHLKAYTPVPGGVGPMTVASLLENTVQAGIAAKDQLTPQ